MKGMNVDFFKDKEFSKFHNVLDSEMKRLQAVGLGTGQRKAEVISFEDEKLMWEKRILGDDNPQSLLDTMLFMNGLYNIEEQQIMERTGFRSAEAVRIYKRTSSHQQQRVSGIPNNEKSIAMPVRQPNVLVYM